MSQDVKEYTIWNGVTPKAITSSTNATPTVLTVTSHGFATGDQVMVFGHTTNTAANGIYKVTVLTSSTFSLQTINNGTNVAGNGVGGATGTVIAAPKIGSLEGFKRAILEFATSGTSTLTAKVLGATGIFSPVLKDGDTPNFGATISATNNYSFLPVIGTTDSVQIDGTTGIVVSGADVIQSYQINIDSIQYITLCISSWTAGAIYAKLSLYTK